MVLLKGKLPEQQIKDILEYIKINRNRLMREWRRYNKRPKKQK
jgi:hypothetical protein